jgi:hypothetical protein
MDLSDREAADSLHETPRGQREVKAGLRAAGVAPTAKEPGRTPDDTVSIRLKDPESDEHPGDQGK